MIFKILVLGIEVRNWGLKVRHSVQWDSCAQQVWHLSLSLLCAHIPGLVGAQGFSLLLPHIAHSCSGLPVEMPARMVIFHFITMSLMFSRHLSCCLCLLFGCIPPLYWCGEYLRWIFLGDLACSHLSSHCSDAWLPAWQTLGLQVGMGQGSSAIKQHQDVNKNKHREKCQTGELGGEVEKSRFILFCC